MSSLLASLIVEARRGQPRALWSSSSPWSRPVPPCRNGIKYLVERARPDFNRLTGFAGTSFPSGHSTAAAATLAAHRLLATRRRSQHMKTLGAGLAAGVAAMVGAHGVVLLGAHCSATSSWGCSSGGRGSRCVRSRRRPIAHLRAPDRHRRGSCRTRFVQSQDVSTHAPLSGKGPTPRGSAGGTIVVQSPLYDRPPNPANSTVRNRSHERRSGVGRSDKTRRYGERLGNRTI